MHSRLGLNLGATRERERVSARIRKKRGKGRGECGMSVRQGVKEVGKSQPREREKVNFNEFSGGNDDGCRRHHRRMSLTGSANCGGYWLKERAAGRRKVGRVV